MKFVKSSVAAALAAAVLMTSVSFDAAEARSRRHHAGNAAVAGAVIGLFGTIATLAARDAYRDRYYGNYGGPYAYSPPPRYYHRHRYWRHRHHHW